MSDVVRMPDEEDVSKALRVLADDEYVHARYHGSPQQTDFSFSANAVSGQGRSHRAPLSAW
jgi:hypothetical protein